MSQRSFHRLVRSIAEVPKWLLSATIVIPVCLFGVGYALGPTVPIENIRSFLSTLATAQAGVLAIVFSITVIAIQLVSTRYSPRMVSLFIDAPIFRFTFWIFIISIASSLASLYFVPQTLTQSYTGVTFAVVGVSIIAVVSLYVFIRTFVERSTPEGLIETFVSDLTPGKYLRECEAMSENEHRSIHPLRPLYSMIMEALSNRERATAEATLHEYGTLAETTLDALADRDVFEAEDRHVANSLYDPVFKEQLHDIALHAEEQDENQIVDDATDIVYNLGKEGLGLCDGRVSAGAILGLSNLITHAPIEENRYRVSNSAWSELGSLLVDAAEHPHPNIVQSATMTIRSRGAWQLRRAPEIRRHRPSMTELYRDMKEAHGHLIDHYASDIASVEMDWQHEHVPDDAPNRKVISAVYQWRNALFKSTTAFLQYRIEDDIYPITEGNFRSTWREICVQAADSEATEYAVVLCQALIEMAFIETVEQPFEQTPVHPRLETDRDERRTFWVRELATVKTKGNPEVVDTAFEKILAYEYTDEEPPLMALDNREEVRNEYYQNVLNISKHRPLNTQSEFPEMIEDIEERVDGLANESE